TVPSTARARSIATARPSRSSIAVVRGTPGRGMHTVAVTRAARIVRAAAAPGVAVGSEVETGRAAVPAPRRGRAAAALVGPAAVPAPRRGRVAAALGEPAAVVKRAPSRAWAADRATSVPPASAGSRAWARRAPAARSVAAVAAADRAVAAGPHAA